MVVLGVVFFILGVALCSLSGFLLVRDYVRRKREVKKAMEESREYMKDFHEKAEQKRQNQKWRKALEVAHPNHYCFYSSEDGGELVIEGGRKKPGRKPGVKRLGMKDCMPKTRGGRKKKKNTEEEQNGK